MWIRCLTDELQINDKMFTGSREWEITDISKENGRLQVTLQSLTGIPHTHTVENGVQCWVKRELSVAQEFAEERRIFNEKDDAALMMNIALWLAGSVQPVKRVTNDRPQCGFMCYRQGDPKLRIWLGPVGPLEGQKYVDFPSVEAVIEAGWIID